MDKSEAGAVEEIDKSSEETLESNHTDNGSKRPNQRLLRLAKFNHGDFNSQKVNANNTNQDLSCTNMKHDVSIEIPPPSYESVVKFNPESNITSTVASSSQLPRYEDVGGLSDAPPPYHSIFTETILRGIHPFNSDDTLHQNVQNARFSSIIVNVLVFFFMASFVFFTSYFYDCNGYYICT